MNVISLKFLNRIDSNPFVKDNIKDKTFLHNSTSNNTLNFLHIIHIPTLCFNVVLVHLL